MPAVSRLFLPVVAVLVLLAQPLAAWASSGIIGDTRCCCPDPDTCICHDHQAADHHDAKMKRCGSHPVRLVAPLVLTAAPPAARRQLVPPRTVTAPAYVVAALRARAAERPEKPPS